MKNYWDCYCELHVPKTAVAFVPEGLTPVR